MKTVTTFNFGERVKTLDENKQITFLYFVYKNKSLKMPYICTNEEGMNRLKKGVLFNAISVQEINKIEKVKFVENFEKKHF